VIREPETSMFGKSGPAPSAVPRGAWLAAWVFMIINALAYLDRQVINLLVDPIRADLGISDFQMSLLQGLAFGLAFSICGLPIGWFVDRFSRRWIVFSATIFWGLATASGGLVRNWWALLASRFGVGAGEAALTPSVLSMLSDLFPRDRLTLATSAYSVGAIFGNAFSLVVGGAIIVVAAGWTIPHLPLLGQIHTWQLVLMMAGVPSLVGAFLIFLVREPVRKGRITTEASPAAASALKYMRSQWRFYACHFTGFGLLNLVVMAYTSWLPTYLMRAFHWSVPQTATTIASVVMTCTVAGMFFSGWLLDYFFRRGVRDIHLRYYVWVTPLALIPGAMSVMASNELLVVACMAAFHFLVPFVGLAGAAIQLGTPGEYRGRVTVIYLFIYNILGWGVGPSLAAAISDFGLGGSAHIGTGLAITMAVMMPVAWIAFALGLKPMRRAVTSCEELSA